ncbi:MAG: aspartate/glutamate racemase family protein [Pseudomonadota bacterium]
MNTPSKTVKAGILMLDTAFIRLPGDIGRADSFRIAVEYHVVRSASVSRVVNPLGVNRELLNRFIESARALESSGASVIGTSCGFLSVAQNELQNAVSVPFFSSSLLALPHIRQQRPEARVGVLTFDAEALSQCHIPAGSGSLGQGIYIQGLHPQDQLRQVIEQDLERIDEKTAGEQVLQRVEDLIERHGPIDALVLECTNLSFWKSAMRAQIGVPVVDLVDMIHAAVNGGRLIDME